MRNETTAIFCCSCKLVFNYTSLTLITFWVISCCKKSYWRKLGARIRKWNWRGAREKFLSLSVNEYEVNVIFQLSLTYFRPSPCQKESLGNFICHNMIFLEGSVRKRNQKRKLKYRVHELLFSQCRNRGKQNKWLYVSAITVSVQPAGQQGEKVTQAKVSMALNLFWHALSDRES